MKVRIAQAPKAADATAVPVAADGIDDPFLTARGFRAKVGEVVAAPATDGRGVVLHVGVGPAAEVTTAVLRRAAGAAARAAGASRSMTLDLGRAAADGVDPVDAARAVAEGAVLGAYRYTAWRSKPDPTRLRQVDVVADAGASAPSPPGRGRRRRRSSRATL